MDFDVPMVFADLVDRLGPPVPVEEARTRRWSELVAAAEAGTITLITRDGYEWAALVPLSEVAEPVAALPVWSLSEARNKLGHVVRESHAVAQVIARHRRPIAAVLDATVLVDRPAPAARIAAEALLQAGHRIELRFDEGNPGRMGHDGDVLEEPEEQCYLATALDHDERTVAVGTGPTLGEALLRLSAPPAVEVADEAPF
ncbi:type II toxin-antitoxin system Phd/YefM family antitoxin [Micromonospora sp. ALFpr18c]|uniref:type II toxin-antitoxin system Phd/YefM family antitoxin n=1 Tax=unclassified Micromonospora TaxID=2617518 RepID=UPI00124BC372|nr:type II toxin-antitoxin system Phd/YefM family antitoxin [Micromonospora sp. ALFpr18c]KAB1935540.1 type II toxin-antitoxin system Phd/YefM family antitoxin [Micromonospora sp. ALFpr18c]